MRPLSFYFFDNNVLDSRDSQVYSARYASIVFVLVFLGWSFFEIFAWAGAVRIEGTISRLFTVEYRCKGGGACHKLMIEVEYQVPGGSTATSRLDTLGGPANPAPGQTVGIMYNPHILAHVFWDSVTLSLLGPALLGIFCVGLAGLGYGFRTSDELAKGNIRRGKLSEIFEAVAGMFDSRARGQDFRSSTFLLAVFSMLGKMAKADGTISREEVSQVESFIVNEFHLKDNERKLAIEIFRKARSTTHTFRDFATDCERLYHRDPGMLRVIYQLLEQLARADGFIVQAEADLLQTAREVFFGKTGSGRQQQSTERTQEQPDSFTPAGTYEALGLQPAASDREVKAAYRKLAMQLHPDRLRAQGLPEGLRKNAEAKFREMQEAYEKICVERGIR